MQRLQIVMIIFLSCLTVTSNTYAAVPGWFGPYSVETIEISDQGVYFLKPSDISAFPDLGCGTAYVFAANATKLGDRAYAMGLTAKAMGKKVHYYLNGCSNSYLQITGMYIDP